MCVRPAPVGRMPLSVVPTRENEPTGARGLPALQRPIRSPRGHRPWSRDPSLCAPSLSASLSPRRDRPQPLPLRRLRHPRTRLEMISELEDERRWARLREGIPLGHPLPHPGPFVHHLDSALRLPRAPDHRPVRRHQGTQGPEISGSSPRPGFEVPAQGAGQAGRAQAHRAAGRQEDAGGAEQANHPAARPGTAQARTAQAAGPAAAGSTDPANPVAD